MRPDTQPEDLQKIARTDAPVFFLKRVWVHEYWPHLQRDPDMPKRDSPDEWIAAVDRARCSCSAPGWSSSNR